MKLIFFDIDDTLYRKRSAFVPASIDLAWQKLRANNIKIGIATGRPPQSFPPAINELIAKHQVDLIVSINGQHISYQGQTLDANIIPLSDIEEIITLCAKKRFPLVFVNENSMVAQAKNEMVESALRQIGAYKIDGDFYKKEQILQVLIFIKAEQEDDLKALSLYPERYKMVRWHENSVDFLPREGSKARGIKIACEKLQIPLSEVMVFGDGLNDIEMFNLVGKAVAMGDSVPELLPHADFITKTIEDDGIYYALQHFGLIN